MTRNHLRRNLAGVFVLPLIATALLIGPRAGLIAQTTLTGNHVITGNLGIGTNSANARLDVNGDVVIRGNDIALDAASDFFDAHWQNFNIYATTSGTLGIHAAHFNTMSVRIDGNLFTDGKAGIGTTSPNAALAVQGDLEVRGNDIALETASDFIDAHWQDVNLYAIKTGILGIHAAHQNTLSIRTDGNLFVDGKVGIGTTEPAASLDVRGGMTVTGPIRIEPQGDIQMGRFGEHEETP